MNIKAKDMEGETALMLAAEGGHETIVGLLLDQGAVVLATNQPGQTAQDIATSKGHSKIVELLELGTLRDDRDQIEKQETSIQNLLATPFALLQTSSELEKKDRLPTCLETSKEFEM